MDASGIITVVLIALAIIFLPVWKFSSLWGGGKTPSVMCGMMLAAHFYTMVK